MTTRETIRAHLDHTVHETHFQHMGMRYKGKVRDTYQAGDVLILVTTDRISAFDHVLRQGIPFKGQVLNRLAAWFFEQTVDVCPNHVIAVPDPNITLAHRCHAVPVEFVVRGYLAGHAWRMYRDGHRTLCGKTLPDGLSQNSRLPEPILTPATKALTGHDEDTTREDIISRGILPESDFDLLETKALALFARGTQLAGERGLILVDTKYEFGRYHDGTYRVIDEIHTPDSSRYFYSDTYDELLSLNTPQRQLSKEFVREWLMDHGFQGRDGERLPDLSNEFRIDVSARYMELYEQVTGSAFDPDTTTESISRMERALANVTL